MGRATRDRLYGTLDLVVLRTVVHGKPLHGYDITERIARVSEDVLSTEEGSLYPRLASDGRGGLAEVAMGHLRE